LAYVRGEGTPVSYATAERDNELTLTDCNGFVVYVAGDDHVTDVGVADDGAWHHVTVTWTSRDGRWNIYKDGRRMDGGRGLAEGRRVAGIFNILLRPLSVCLLTIHRTSLIIFI